MSILSFADIQSAACQIEGVATRTPLLEFPQLNALVDGRVFLKPECLQRKGAFKFRGAYNFLSRIAEKDRAKGVVACSSGNHAQGVAEAARLLDIPAAIVMPEDAPEVKVAGTRASGAEIIFYDRYNEDREAIAKALCEEREAFFVHPFNEPLVMAGQGTLALEAAEDLTNMDVQLDCALVPASGGGLAAGVGVALHETFADCEVWGCEPFGHDDLAASLEAGEPVAAPVIDADADIQPSGLCDALMAPMPGDKSFQVMKDHLKGVFVVSDVAVLDAVAYALRELHLVVEPGGAVALAALLAGQMKLKGRSCLVVLSGGNADPYLLAKALQSEA